MDHAGAMAKRARKTTEPEARLSAADWEAAALSALSESGLAGVAVEPLARRLGVTKGSFYWHFQDREALLRAALGRWEADYTERVIEALAGVADPRERLVRLIADVTMATRGPFRIHAALGAATGDPLIRAALARVSRRRLGYLEDCYSALGLSRRAAKRRALLAYAAYVGLIHIRLEAPGELPADDDLARYVAHVIATLVP
jgi:AcrR family transcriptional regulator